MQWENSQNILFFCWWNCFALIIIENTAFSLYDNLGRIIEKHTSRVIRKQVANSILGWIINPLCYPDCLDTIMHLIYSIWALWYLHILHLLCYLVDLLELVSGGTRLHSSLMDLWKLWARSYFTHCGFSLRRSFEFDNLMILRNLTTQLSLCMQTLWAKSFGWKWNPLWALSILSTISISVRKDNISILLAHWCACCTNAIQRCWLSCATHLTLGKNLMLWSSRIHSSRKVSSRSIVGSTMMECILVRHKLANILLAWWAS